MNGLIPNLWRVITKDNGRLPPDTFYVLRNPPNIEFAKDDSGNRRKFESEGDAQAFADRMNAGAVQ